jgi:tetratricopeptide (TPR) repeat protein
MKSQFGLLILMVFAGCASMKKKQAEKNYREGLALIEANLVYNHLDRNYANQAFPLLEKAVKGDPTNAGYQNALGLAYYHLGDTAGANRQFTKALQLASWYTSALVNLGLTHDAMGAYDKALDYYLTARNTDPKNPTIELNIGLLFDKLNDSLKARLHYGRAIAIDSNYFLAYHNRAISYYINGRYEAALNDCNKVLRSDTIAVRTRFQKAMTLTMLGDYTASVNEYNRALRYEPNNHQLYYSRGLAHLYAGDTAAAINDFVKSSELNPNDVTPFLYLSSTYYTSNNYTKALEYSNKSLNLQATGMGYYGRAVCYQMLHDTLHALLDYDKAIAIDQYYDAYLEKSRLLAASGHYKEAINCLDTVIALDRTKSEPVLLKAALYENAIAEMTDEEKRNNQRHYLWLAYSMDTTRVSTLEQLTGYYAFNVLPPQADSAVYFANKWVQYAQNKNDAYYIRGVSNYFGGNYAAALHDLETAFGLDSVDYATPNAMGLVYMALKKYDTAILWYNRSLALHPTYAYAMNNKANTLFAMGKKSEACEWWKKVLALGYSYETKWKIQYKIDDPRELVKKQCGP